MARTLGCRDRGGESILHRRASGQGFYRSLGRSAKHFPAESQEEICRANFTVAGFDRLRGSHGDFASRNFDGCHA